MAEFEIRVVGEHLCPRRSEGVPAFARETTDRWEVRNDPEHPGLLNTGIASCSYCGSMHPDDFMEKVKQGWIVGPTDKSYKCYVAEPRPADEMALAKSKWLSGDLARELTAKGGGASAEVYWDEQEAPLHRGVTRAKFYFQHLSEIQRGEFIDLLNDGTMQLGYPSHFYTLPFFARRA